MNIDMGLHGLIKNKNVIRNCSGLPCRKIEMFDHDFSNLYQLVKKDPIEALDVLRQLSNRNWNFHDVDFKGKDAELLQECFKFIRGGAPDLELALETRLKELKEPTE